MNAAVLTFDQYRNEGRMRRLRDHYTHTLSNREHSELIRRGEAIREGWNAQPIPSHRALTVLAPSLSSAGGTCDSPRTRRK